MIATGARVSEVLGVQTNQVSPTGHLIVHAKKGSVVRVTYAPQAHPLVGAAISRGAQRIFEGYTYKKFKRDLLSVDPTIFKRFGFRRAVTNIFRRTAAEICFSLGDRNRSIPQEFLGHKSPTSTDHYLTKRKEG
jgi:integrase